MKKKDIIELAIRLSIALGAIIVACLCGFASWQLGAPQQAPAPLALSETFYGRTVAAKTTGDRIAWAKQAVSVAPARAENWVLLAYAYQSQDNRLSPRVLGALRQSYTVSPLSPDASEWRLNYLFSNWSLMPKDLRALAFREAEAFVTRDSGYTYLNELAHTLTDRQGRLTLGLVVMSRRSTQQAIWSGGIRAPEQQ